MTLRRYIAPSRVRGAFRHHIGSGSMAGLASGAAVVSLRNGSLNPVAIRRILFGFAATEDPFIFGKYRFEIFMARNFTASDSGGTAVTLSGDNGKLKTAFDTTDLTDFRISAGAALVTGTRTLDANALAALSGSVGPEPNKIYIPSGTPLFSGTQPDDWPIVLELNEGLVIAATLPAVGGWRFDCGLDYHTYDNGAL